MDYKLFEIFHSLVGRWSGVDWAVVFLAKILPFFLVIVAIIFVFSLKNQKKSLLVLSIFSVSVILSRGLLTEVIAFFYNKPRPFELFGFEPLIVESTSSFPSGHAAFFFALAAAMFFFNRKLGTWFLFFAFINGLARVVSGVHFPVDILGGAIIGVISFFAVQTLFAKDLSAFKNLTGENA